MQNENVDYAATFSRMLDSELLNIEADITSLNEKAKSALQNEILSRGIVNDNLKSAGAGDSHNRIGDESQHPSQKTQWIWPYRLVIIVAFTAIALAAIPASKNSAAEESLGAMFVYLIGAQMSVCAMFRLSVRGTSVLSLITAIGFVAYAVLVIHK